MNSRPDYKLLTAIAFAADKHKFQTRKDTEGTPYINHPLEVALTLMGVGKESDHELLVSAVLHDTIEDTQTTPEEIEALFGHRVLSIVLEVTDDKKLPKEQRKLNQVLYAPMKSIAAKKLKLADKICNVHDIIHRPPVNWSVERKIEYLHWAGKVLEGLEGANPLLEERLKELISEGFQRFQVGDSLLTDLN